MKLELSASSKDNAELLTLKVGLTSKFENIVKVETDSVENVRR